MRDIFLRLDLRYEDKVRPSGFGDNVKLKSKCIQPVKVFTLGMLTIKSIID